MPIRLQISLLLGVFLYFAVIIVLLRRKTLELRYSLLWIVTGFIMLIAVLFPIFALKVSNFLGIVTLTNALFALTLFFLILIMISMTSVITKLNNQNKVLAQNLALLEKRMRKIEGKDTKDCE